MFQKPTNQSPKTLAAIGSDRTSTTTMTEKTLKEYFEGKISTDKLNDDLKDTVSGNGVVSYYDIEEYRSDAKFTVTTKQIIQLCHDVLNENIRLEDLKTIAFCLEASDYFVYDSETPDGNKVQDFILNWTSPEINTPTTIGYVQYCAYYLETGEHR